MDGESVNASAARTKARVIEIVWVAISIRRLSIRSARTPAKRPSSRNGTNRKKMSSPTRERRLRLVVDEPGKRDVLHPGPGQRDELADEEEAVVPMLGEAGCDPAVPLL